MKIFKFLQWLVSFGNLRFAEIKSCPSASPTYELRKVEISYQKWLRGFTKGLGFGWTPPPHVGKNSQKMSFFFGQAPLVLPPNVVWTVYLCGKGSPQYFWVGKTPPSPEVGTAICCDFFCPWGWGASHFFLLMMSQPPGGRGGGGGVKLVGTKKKVWLNFLCLWGGPTDQHKI